MGYRDDGADSSKSHEASRCEVSRVPTLGESACSMKAVWSADKIKMLPASSLLTFDPQHGAAPAGQELIYGPVVLAGSSAANPGSDRTNKSIGRSRRGSLPQR